MSKKKNAQAVTEETQKELSNPEVEAVPEVVEQPKPLTQKQRLDKIEAELAKADQNFQIIGGYLEKLKPLISLSEQLQAQQQTQTKEREQPQKKPLNLAGLSDFLPLIMQMMGQSSNTLGDELTKKVMDAGLQQMFAGTELLKAMQTRMLADMGAKQIKKTFEE